MQTALPVLAAGVFAFWAMSTWVDEPSLPLRLGLPLASALGAGALAWRCSARPAQWLAWDGQGWLLDGQPGDLQLMIDAGGGLLVRHAGKRWLVAGRQAAGAAWHGLRVAVYARAGTAANGNALRDA